jgi:hypothetical protein
MAPEDHPASVYLWEDRAAEKVIQFLTERVFGPERVLLLRDALGSCWPAGPDERRG